MVDDSETDFVPVPKFDFAVYGKGVEKHASVKYKDLGLNIFSTKSKTIVKTKNIAPMLKPEV